jgi:AcrR family transcriptional regulator|tara:strand:+ start:72 stop:722 length:651 start_codon:yes stop_codon:yes gene_type:complete
VAKVAKIKSKKRLTPKDREQEIIDEAVQFFAEVGFDGKTRDLAKRIGITQPLLYRYFPTKDDLIERVYKEVYVNQMDPDWSLKLQDRSVPLEQRLIDYYKSYAKVVHRYEWIRIYFFSGLKGNPLNRRYIRVVEEKILKPIGAEIRETCDLPSVKEVPLTPIELERIWVMHGGLFYYAVRKNIYHSNVFDDFEAIVTSTVKVMLEGAKTFSIEELH